jgi:hypothetical protein
MAVSLALIVVLGLAADILSGGASCRRPDAARDDAGLG